MTMIPCQSWKLKSMTIYIVVEKGSGDLIGVIRNLTERTLRLPINLRLVEGSDSESLRKLTGSKFMPVILSEVGRIIKKEYPDFKLPPMPPIPYMDFTDSEMKKFSEIEKEVRNRTEELKKKLGKKFDDWHWGDWAI